MAMPKVDRVPPHSEGERLLRELARSRSLRAIARELGCSVNAVYRWLDGSARPHASKRALASERLNIHPGAWDEAPLPPGSPPGAAGAPAAALAAPGAPTPTPSTLDDCMASLAKIREQRNRPRLASAEQVRLATAETRLLQLRARLERDQEQTESRIVYAHPTWRRIKHILRMTLAKHPAALKDVVNALGEAMAEDSNSNGVHLP